MAALLEVKNFEAAYGPTRVLFGIDFAVEDGGISTILGANGAGKTTTLRAVSGMIGTSGSVSFDGERIDRVATEEIVRMGIAHVPEGRGTFTSLTVEDNLTLGAYTRKDRDQVARDFERVYGYFPVLHERRLQQAGTLSGGEQQMLAIARGLMLKPRLMLLDEPSFGLAPMVVQALFEIMRQVNRNEGVSMLLVEQDAALALELADQAYLLETGRVVISGAAADIKGDDSVRRAYLGY
ncbi:MAG: ABC transporter ATP-binding protein [Alphaproteobacteria bacterium]|jgi:branched-chain amino acid transport system ATP-binding protein|nr:ABC transporter ATP-binding protein [Alphaproteobacteria bacterium]MDP6517218.1 ABC transporter ATP-binding protein [Alphaproteobacteria bacterium]